MSEEKKRISVGIVLDGNRRWAKEQGLSTLKGHEAGAEKIREVAKWAIEANISHLYLYTFSTENWKRSEEEVGYLMRLLERVFNERMQDIEELGVRIRVVGERERFNPRFQKLMHDVEARSRENTTLTMVVCLSYGGRREIVAGVNALLASGVQKIDEGDFGNALWTGGMPDPDIIIRPGGEKRLSNFLTWQSVYSELFFVEPYWPAFSKDDFFAILAEYDTRERRRGQ